MVIKRKFFAGCSACGHTQEVSAEQYPEDWWSLQVKKVKYKNSPSEAYVCSVECAVRQLLKVMSENSPVQAQFKEGYPLEQAVTAMKTVPEEIVAKLMQKELTDNA